MAKPCGRQRSPAWTALTCSARHVARVPDSRVRRMIARRRPAARSRWADRILAFDDGEVARFMSELACAMDERTHRIGGHAADTFPSWALQALGEVPADPVGRAEWQRRAAAVGAYRELYGHDSPADPIGPPRPA